MVAIQSADDDPPEVFVCGDGDLSAEGARELAAMLLATADQLDALLRS